MADEKIIERIRKLLALSKSSNVHEAQLAMQKVNELLTTYQIEMSEILIKETATLQAEFGDAKEVSETYRSFVRNIAWAAAYLFDTHVVRGKNQAQFAFVGLPEDIKASEILFDYLFESWKSIVSLDCKTWKENYKYGWGMSDTPSQYEVKQYKIGHGQGFSDVVMTRAHKLAQERKQKITSTGTALVVAKSALIKSFLDENTVEHKGKGYKEQDYGRNKGIERGKAIPLSGALTHEEGALLNE